MSARTLLALSLFASAPAMADDFWSPPGDSVCDHPRAAPLAACRLESGSVAVSDGRRSSKATVAGGAAVRPWRGVR